MPMLSVENAQLLLVSVLPLGIMSGFSGKSQVTRLEVPQQQFIALLVVAGRLGKGNRFSAYIRHAHAEAVGLHAVVRRPFLSRRIAMNARQQPAGRVAGYDVRIDRLDEQVVVGVLAASARR